MLSGNACGVSDNVLGDIVVVVVVAAIGDVIDVDCGGTFDAATSLLGCEDESVEKARECGTCDCCPDAFLLERCTRECVESIHSVR
jgi:hypothetical protein